MQASLGYIVQLSQKKTNTNQKPIQQNTIMLSGKQKLLKQAKSQTKRQAPNQAAENYAQENVRNKCFSYNENRAEQNKSPPPVPKMYNYRRLQPNQQLLMSRLGRRSHEPALHTLLANTGVPARRLGVRLSEQSSLL